MATYEIGAGDTLRLDVDFRPYVESLGNNVGVSYQLRHDLGVSVEVVSTTPGLFAMTVSGGVLGGAYAVGIEARASDGRGSQVIRHRVRVRPALPGWVSLPPAIEIGGSNILLLVDAEGRVLVDELGRALYITG